MAVKGGDWDREAFLAVVREGRKGEIAGEG